MKNWLLAIRKMGTILALILCAATALAQGRAPQFEKGDRVAFIGDSITHGGSYHSVIYLFYATRFPGRPLTIHNCGISGDTAPGAVRRFDWDIAANKPTVATIMLGMNDVGGNYGADKPAAQVAKSREAALAPYRKAMTELAGQLRRAGVRTIFITPSIYDQTAVMEKPGLKGKNEALGMCAEFVKGLAARGGAGLVDFYQPMNAINAAAQKRDPAFTIVGKDRVHPGAVGHFVMAYEFLKAQGMPKIVARMALDAAGRVEAAENCQISGAKAEGGALAFTCLEGALPCPVLPWEKKALDLVPFMEELNQELLSVKGLEPGDYELKIDGVAVGHYPAAALEKGINLAANEATPQYRQAMVLANLNGKRLKESQSLRSVAYIRHSMIKPAQMDEKDTAALKRFFAQAEEQVKGQSWAGYRAACVKQYQELAPKEEPMKRALDDEMREMYRINKPAPHRFEIVKK